MHALNKFSRISKSKLLKVPRKKNLSGRLIFFFPPKHGFGPCTNIKIHCSFFPSFIKNIRTSPVSCALSCIHSSRGPTESGLYFFSCHANFPACCLSRSTHTHMPEHLQTHILPYFLTAESSPAPKGSPGGAAFNRTWPLTWPLLLGAVPSCLRERHKCSKGSRGEQGQWQGWSQSCTWLQGECHLGSTSSDIRELFIIYASLDVYSE